MTTILVIDDNLDILKVIKQALILHNPKWNVITLSESTNSLTTIKKNKVSLVLLDIMMPGADGWTVLEQIRESEFKDLPVIFITAKTDKITKEFASLCVDDYIEKPFKIKDMIAKIKRHLTKKKK